MAGQLSTQSELEELRSRNPLARVPSERRNRWLLWAVIAVVITGSFMVVVSADLTREGRANIVELELASDVSRAHAIIEQWGPEGRAAALASLWADYPFLIAYAIALGMACLILSARALERGWAVTGRLGLVMAWSALLAGFLDAAENAFLISEFATGPTVRQVAGARTAAWSKFALLAVVFVYLSSTAIAVVASRRSLRAADADDPADRNRKDTQADQRAVTDADGS